MLGKFRNMGAALCAVAALSTPATGESLAEALTSAYTHSGLLEQNRAVLRAADEDVATAVAALRPVVTWSSTVTRSFGYSGATSSFGTFSKGGSASVSSTLSLIASLVVYDGGDRKLRIDAAKEAVLATRAGLVSVEQQILFRGVQAFMEVRRAIETVSLRQNNVRVIQQELRAARDRFEVGEVTRTDVALAEARSAAAASALSSAQGQLVIAVEEFRAAVGRKPGNLVAPRGLPRLPGNVEQAKAEAMRRHPSMTQAQHVVTARELGILIGEAQLRPTVTLRGQLGTTQTFQSRSFSNGGSIALNAEGPIYQGGARLASIRKARAERDDARANLHIVGLQLAQDVGNAYAQLEVARASRVAFESQVRASTVAFRGVREEAKLGARTTLDVLDAEQELLDARASLVSAQVDETIAAYAVLASLGKLTAEDLHLNVPRYDPAEYYNLVKTAPAATSRQSQQLDRVLRALGKE